MPLAPSPPSDAPSWVFIQAGFSNNLPVSFSLLTHSLLEPGGPCIKPMRIRKFSSKRVKTPSPLSLSLSHPSIPLVFISLVLHVYLIISLFHTNTISPTQDTYHFEVHDSILVFEFLANKYVWSNDEIQEDYDMPERKDQRLDFVLVSWPLHGNTISSLVAFALLIFSPPPS